jgi:type II secretion system protein J
MRRGMTLIEVLVAMTIGSIVVAAVLGVLGAAQRAREQGESRADLFQPVRVTLNQMERDLRVAVTRTNDQSFTFTGTDETTDGLPTDRLEFSTAAGDPLSSVLPTGNLLRVQYYLSNTGETRWHGLVREALALPLPAEVAAAQEELATREYCAAAVGLDLTYYDPTQKEWGEDWTERTDLPSAVRIVLYVLPPATRGEEPAALTQVQPFSTLVQLTLAGAPLGTGQTAGASTTPQLPGATGAPTTGLPTSGLPSLPTPPVTPPSGGELP